jgi:hypothetical protein
MKTTQLMHDDVLARRGVDVLMKSLGPVETTRFLTLRTDEREESVRRHRRWQAGLNKTAFFHKVFVQATAGK